MSTPFENSNKIRFQRLFKVSLNFFQPNFKNNLSNYIGCYERLLHQSFSVAKSWQVDINLAFKIK
jgi:hypothetical protein